MGKKVPKQNFKIDSHKAKQTQIVDDFFGKKPSWVFTSIDNTKWTIDKDTFWNDILPKLREFETQTWNEIFLAAKKENHSINVTDLNPVAQKRLEELYIEAESIRSLRFTGKIRLYGYMQGSAFCILWYDTDHGDNNTCVCRSRKKHT